MTSGNGTQHGDWDQRREQLSAYLDGELADGERKVLEAHLVGCAECQRELAQLRHVRKLLRALPTPALPRSFTLPVQQPAPARLATPPVRRGGRLARATQWTGGVAASVGLLLILGSALMSGSIGPSGAGSSYAPSASSSRQSSNGAEASSTTTHAPSHVGVQGSATPTPQPSSSSSDMPGVTPSITPDVTPSQIARTPTEPPQFGNENTTVSASTTLGLTGAGLAGGGALLFVGGSIGRRRRR